MSNASAFEVNALDSRIRELVAFARTRSNEDRSVLFRNLVDLFLTGKAPKTQPTRAQLLDVIEALIPHVEAESRRTVADVLANMQEPPVDLCIRLCRDRASIVSNLIKAAPLDEDDIIELIQRTGREHHQLLAAREDLSANVWIALARAAPSAPPFDHQSTLALWSDDLGITRTAASEPTITPLHVPSPQGPAATQTATQAASAKGIRIIKTDEDLIAERREHSSDIAEAPAHTEKKEIDTEATIELHTPEQPASSKQVSVSKEVANEALSQFISDENGRSPAQDPGPGGWAWQTDRDGLVINISPHGCKLLGKPEIWIGVSVLDMLGLNTRIGHPVARAFQRRSTIHDAPILLSMLDTGQQHWTLEATPQFSNCGGIFEGYEGILTPVAAAKDVDDIVIPSEDEASAMFLDDIVSDAIPTPQEKAEEPEEPATPENVLQTAAANAIQDIIAQTLGTAISQPPEDEAPKPVSSATKELTNVENTANAPQVSATLDLLEEAIDRLTKAAQDSTQPGIRLQCEIAAACARSLREQLT